ncbi:hypothetical protein [Kaistella flava (ex Peng et al. 2021)]|nr:hypothetical protein [Kaistella flava (ex Peng et al. 2021)]
MSTEKLTQDEKFELLNEFQMEELEQRFEMTSAAAVEDGGEITVGVSWTF